MGAGTQSVPTNWSNPYGANPQVKVDATLDRTGSSPTGQGALKYRSSDEGACTVGADSGRVTGVSRTGTCTIEAQFRGNSNYGASGWSDVATITILKGDQGLPVFTGQPYASNPVVGGAAVAINAQSVPSGNTALAYQVTNSSYCSVSTSGGAVTAKVAGATQNCVVQAQFIGDNDYNASNWQTIATLAIQKGTITFATTPVLSYAESLRVGNTGDELEPSLGATSDDDNSVSVSWYYTVQGRNSADDADKARVCGISNGNIVVGGAATVGDKCKITAVGSATGYNDYTGVAVATLTVVEGLITWATWTVDTAQSVGVDYRLPNVGGLRNGDSATYHKTSGNNCSLSGQVLSFAGTGNCVVEARVARSQYETLVIEKTISVGNGAIAFTPTPTLTYTGSLRFGDTTTALTPSLGGTSDDDNSVEVTWNYSVAGTNSSDVAKQNVCALSGRNIVGGSAAAVGDKCKVTVVGEATGYNDYTSVAVVTLTVGRGIITGVTWGVDTSQNVGVAYTLPEVAGAEATDTVTYHKTSGGDCTLSGRALTFTGTSDCVVEARVARTHYDRLDVEKTITVGKGSIAFGTTPTLTYSGGLHFE